MRRPVPHARHVGRDLLQLEGQVWRHDSAGGKAVEGARRRERQAEADAGGRDAGQNRCIIDIYKELY